MACFLWIWCGFCEREFSLRLSCILSEEGDLLPREAGNHHMVSRVLGSNLKRWTRVDAFVLAKRRACVWHPNMEGCLQRTHTCALKNWALNFLSLSEEFKKPFQGNCLDGSRPYHPSLESSGSFSYLGLGGRKEGEEKPWTYGQKKSWTEAGFST